MFLARATGDDEEQLFVLGLSRTNVTALLQGHPIHLSRASHGMPMPAHLTIILFAGETDDTLEADVAAFMGPATVVDHARPH
jgi:hypothetical protein